jgi:dipeptidyl-peptidase-3
MATAVHVVRPEDASSIAVLAAAIPFAALDEKEALYAHAVAGACWGGAPICSLQCSVESVPLLALLRAWLGDRSAEEARAAAVAAGVALADVESFAAFASNLIDNLGNYRSFGDTKMVPAVSAAAFETVLRSSPGWGPGMSALWAWSGALAYDMRPRLRQLGWGPTAGISTYYSASIVETDAAIVQKLLDAQRQPQPYNTRIFKLGDVLQLRLASAATGAGPPDLLLGSHDVDGTTVEVVRGDYAPLMGRVVACLERAREHAANENQVAALDGYISSFSTGSQSAFIAGSAAWVRDKGPVVESYIGFIESYKDPSGTRGEWEGFVACVNKVQSAQFGALVAAAEPLIAQLPWGSTFEKDSFLRPDFTSLEVLAFASSGIPGGCVRLLRLAAFAASQPALPIAASTSPTSTHSARTSALRT